jgi:hypothetical protein
MRSLQLFSRRSIVIALCGILPILAMQYSPTPGAPVGASAAGKGDPKEFAQSALDEYIKTILSERNAVNFGFRDIQEASAAKVGDALPVMFIGLSDLKTYKPGSGVQPILQDAKALWFPVQVAGRIITKIEIVDINGQWVASEFGGVATVNRIDTALQQQKTLLAKADVGQEQPTMLLKIPALEAVFLLIETQQGAYLIPAMIQPERFQLAEANIYPVEQVLVALSKLAQEIDPKTVG